MGKFIESLVIAAQDSGFKNYTHAPFCLRIDFTGWEYFSLKNIGNLGTTPAYIPIQIIKMDFQVTDQGSVYEVEAVVYNDGALADHINETKTPVTIHGKTVAELLSDVSSEDSLSLTKVLNDRIEDLEEENKITVYDRFVIMFPTDVAAMTEQLSAIETTDSTSQTVENTDEEITVNTNISVFESVKSISISSDQINEIGNSRILDGKDCPIQKMVLGEEGVIDRSESSYKNPLVKQFEYSQYDRITNIIEDIITRSEYASQEDDGSGFKKWFRIQTKILLDPNPEIIDQLGRPAKVYVFMVTPYITHEGKLVGPQQVPRGMDQIRASAVKEYNYYYTGLNEDVLDFKINFNNAFFNVFYSDLGISPASPASDSTAAPRVDKKVVDPKSSQNQGGKKETREGLESNDPPHGNTGARYTSEYGDRTRLAKLILDRIVNSPVDMITAEIDIWGDPYFIPSDIGNYSPEVQSYAVSVDNTMSYVNNEVYVIVNFRTPFDYQKDGSLMDIPGEYTTFSGVYQIWGVTNTFSNGEFKQNLKMIRINKQTEDEDATLASVIQNTGGYVPDNYSIGYGVGQVDPRLASAVGIGPTLALSTVDTSGANVGEPTTTSATSPTALGMTASFNPDGTVQGSGQSARPGPGPAPTPTTTETVATRPPVSGSTSSPTSVPNLTGGGGGLTIVPTNPLDNSLLF